MNPEPKPEDDAFLARLYQLFREYFRLAERKRRWSIDDDIPWNQCNPRIKGVVADVVETFCAVELYLPDYLSKLIPQVRANRGRAWFLANWGYEESKHSMVLGDWLLKSGQRSDEQMTDLEARVFEHEYDLPSESALGMLCYAMIQELATWLNYCQLRHIVREVGGDTALERILALISIDERAHYDFFRKVVGLYLERDRAATLGHLRDVVYNFQMPAVNLLADGRKREADFRALRIFDEEIFFLHVVEPALGALGLSKADLKPRRARREVVLIASP
jgi:acyl-[acyl-carrier-protein] desaturase